MVQRPVVQKSIRADIIIIIFYFLIFIYFFNKLIYLF